MCNIEKLKATLKEGEIIDETTAHKIAEVNGELVEYKYCIRCGEWHELGDFYSSKNTKDKLDTYCIDCRYQIGKEYQKNRKQSNPIVEESKVEIADTIEASDMECEEYDTLKENLDSFFKDYTAMRNRVSVLERENMSKHDLKCLSTNEIEKVLNDSKCTLRMLFDAIKNRTDRYSFYAIDSETGCTIPIAFDINTN